MESVFWPIVVEGSSKDDEWPVVERQAAAALHRLVCVLSLAWNEPWQVRTAPWDLERMSVDLADDWIVPRNSLIGFRENPQIGMYDDQALPSWVDAALVRLDGIDGTDADNVGAALSLWHQGILLQPEHPSLALVAFVASIEQDGSCAV